MISTNWTYHKEQSFATHHLIFLKILFQFKNLLQRVDLMYQQPKCPYFYCLLFGGAFFACEYPWQILPIKQKSPTPHVLNRQYPDG